MSGAIALAVKLSMIMGGFVGATKAMSLFYKIGGGKSKNENNTRIPR